MIDLTSHDDVVRSPRRSVKKQWRLERAGRGVRTLPWKQPKVGGGHPGRLWGQGAQVHGARQHFQAGMPEEDLLERSLCGPLTLEGLGRDPSRKTPEKLLAGAS